MQHRRQGKSMCKAQNNRTARARRAYA
jgi:hypothetical protein